MEEDDDDDYSLVEGNERREPADPTQGDKHNIENGDGSISFYGTRRFKSREQFQLWVQHTPFEKVIKVLIGDRKKLIDVEYMSSADELIALDSIMERLGKSATNVGCYTATYSPHVNHSAKYIHHFKKIQYLTILAMRKKADTELVQGVILETPRDLLESILLEYVIFDPDLEKIVMQWLDRFPKLRLIVFQGCQGTEHLRVPPGFSSRLERQDVLCMEKT